jgi:hypothetical protein
MYNSETPARMELPTSRQLARSTFIALVSAIVLLVAVVLPAEYGIDPTGAGRLLGLAEMGRIKQQLAAEAVADAAAGPQAAAVASARSSAAPGTLPAVGASAPTGAASPAAGPAAAAPASWRDEVRFTLAPGEGIEIKLRMNEGARAEFAWAVAGGVVNCDTHGDGGGRSISYAKGRGLPSDEGEIVAAFTGNHGWFWRNRGQAEVQVVLRTRGQYLDIKRRM